MTDNFSLGRFGKSGEIDFSKLRSGITKEDLGIGPGTVLATIFDKINTNTDGDSATRLDREELNAFIQAIRDLAGNQRLSAREAKKYEIDNLTKKDKKQLIEFLQNLSKLTLNVQNLKIQEKSELITFDDGHTEEIFPNGSKISTKFNGGKTTIQKFDENGKITEEIVKEGDKEVKTENTNSGKKVTITTPDATEIVQYDTNGNPKSKKITDNTTGIIEEFVFENGKPILKRKTDPRNNQVITYDGTRVTTVTEKDGVRTTVVKDGENTVSETTIRTNENGQVEKKVKTYDGDNLTEDFYVDDKQKYQRKVVDDKEYRVDYDENGNTKGVIVQYGETPSAIAERFGCSLEELAAANKDKLKGKGKNRYFRAGDEIVIPGKLAADAKVLQGRKSREEVLAQVERAEAQRRAAASRRRVAEDSNQEKVLVKGGNGYYVTADSEGKLRYYNPQKQEITPEEFKKRCPSIYENVNGIKTVVRNKYDVKTIRKEAKELAIRIKQQINGASLNNRTVGFLNSITPENAAFVVEAYAANNKVHIADDLNDEWGLDIKTIKEHICKKLCQQAKKLGVQGVYYGDYYKINDIKTLKEWINKSSTLIIRAMLTAKETVKINPNQAPEPTAGEKAIQKQSAKQIVDDLKKATFGSNDFEKIKTILDRIDNPEELAEVERLLVLEGYTIDSMYSPIEKFMREELQRTGMDYTCEDLEAYVQKWIANGVIKGNAAIDAQARLAARVIIEAGDGFGTDCDETKKGIALIKAPAGQGKDAAKKVYDKVNKIIAGHGTFYGIGTKSNGLIDYLDGEVWDGEIKYLKGILAETDALQGAERAKAVRDLAEEASAGMGTDEEYLRQAIKGIRTREDRIAVEAKIKEYCLKKGIKPQIEGQSYIQALLYDESNFKEIRQYNEMLIEQGVYNEQEIVNLRAEQAALQMLEGDFTNIREAVREIKDPKVYSRVLQILKTKGYNSIDAFLQENMYSATQTPAIKAELINNNLLDDNAAADVAFKLIQEGLKGSSHFMQLGLSSIKNENVAQLVDTKLKEMGSSLEKVQSHYNKLQRTSNVKHTNVDYITLNNAQSVTEEKKAAYQLTIDDLESRINDLEKAYQEVCDKQGTVSSFVNSLCEGLGIGVTREDIETRLQYDRETLRLLKIAKEGRLGKMENGKTVSVTFEDIFKERQSVSFRGSNVVKVNGVNATTFNSAKVAEVAGHKEKVGALFSLKEAVVNSWTSLEEGINTKDAKRLAVAIYDTLKKLSSISGQEMSLAQFGYSLNSQGVIVDKQGKPVSVDKLVEIAKQLKKGLADVANNSFGTSLKDTASASSVRSILENSYQKEVDSFKEKYKEAFGQEPPQDLLDEYISTIQNGMMVINFGVAIGAALLVPFTGGGSLVAFLGVTGSAASAIAVGVNVGVATMALNTFEHSTDADGLNSREFADDSEQAFWAAITSAVGARVGMFAEAKVAQILPKYRAIAAKWSLANLEQTEKAAVIMARLEALGIEFSSDTVQSVVEMFAREGKLDGPAFRSALIMSLVGNTAGHAMSARGDLKADVDAPNARPSVDDVVHDYNAPGPRADVRARQAEIQANEHFVQIGKKRIDIATATEAELREARKQVAQWADGTRNRQEMLDLIDQRLSNVRVREVNTRVETERPVEVDTRAFDDKFNNSGFKTTSSDQPGITVDPLGKKKFEDYQAELQDLCSLATTNDQLDMLARRAESFRSNPQRERFLEIINNRRAELEANPTPTRETVVESRTEYRREVVDGEPGRSSEIVGALNQSTAEQAGRILADKGHVTPEEFAVLETHIVNNLKTPEQVDEFIQQLRSRVGVDHNGNMHVYQVGGEDYGAMAINRALAQKRKIQANMADFNNVKEILENVINNKKGLSAQELASIRAFADKAETIEELQTILEQLNKVKKSDATRALKKYIEKQIELRRTPADVGVNEPVVRTGSDEPGVRTGSEEPGVRPESDEPEVRTGSEEPGVRTDNNSGNSRNITDDQFIKMPDGRRVHAEINRDNPNEVIIATKNEHGTTTVVFKNVDELPELGLEIGPNGKIQARKIVAPSAGRRAFSIAKEKVDALLDMLPTQQLKTATNFVIEKIKSLKTLADYSTLKTKINTMYDKYKDVKTQLLKWLDEKFQSIGDIFTTKDYRILSCRLDDLNAEKYITANNKVGHENALKDIIPDDEARKLAVDMVYRGEVYFGVINGKEITIYSPDNGYTFMVREITIDVDATPHNPGQSRARDAEIEAEVVNAGGAARATDDVNLNGSNIEPQYRRNGNGFNPDELVRNAGNNGNPINENYVQASMDLRRHYQDAIANGTYADSYQSYVNTMTSGHRVAYGGFDGNHTWYGDVGQGHIEVNPGYIRGEGQMVSRRSTEGMMVEEIASRYGDFYSITGSSELGLVGISREARPMNIGTAHYYPNGKYLDQYFKQMYRTAQEALDLIRNGAPQDKILAKLAEHYQYAANARPFGQINNSLFMNEINTLLEQAGMKPMPHGMLDHVAQRLQPESFKQYFIDEYKRTALDA